MDDGEGEFIEQMTRQLSNAGLPPVAGRMWAYLLISDPPEQTAAQIAEELHASRGSISSAARLLETAHLVQRRTRRGERSEYFSLPESSMLGMMRAQIPVVRAFRETADRGLELLADRPPEQRARLQGLRDLYAFFEVELPASLERFLEQRKDRNA